MGADKTRVGDSQTHVSLKHPQMRPVTMTAATPDLR